MKSTIQQMKFRSRGGIIQLIVGLPCAALGIAQIHSGITSRLGVEPVLILVGLFFTLAGIAVAFTRKGVIIDNRSGMVIQWIGLLMPMHKATTPLSMFENVGLTKKVIKGDRYTTTVYPVSLMGKEVEIQCDKPESYQRSRQLAEKLAKFLDLGLSDRSGGKEIYREVSQLDESIRERAARTGESISWVEPPVWSLIQYEKLGKDLVIDLPARKFNLSILPVLLFVTLLSWPFIDVLDVPREYAMSIRWGLFLLMALILVVDFFPSWRQAAWGYRVTASGKRLTVSRRTFFIPKKKTIPADELEEFQAFTITRFVSGAKGMEMLERYQWLVGLLRMLGVFRGKLGVRARSDRVTCVFGSNLEDEEIQWLHDVLKYVLVTAPR